MKVSDVWRRMKALLRTLSFFQVLLCVEGKSQSGNVVTGTERGSVEIYCTYPDGYQYVSKYFCRDPCGYSDVLVKTEKADNVFSKGRYSILNTVSTRSFSVTIKNLRLGDSGVYYCGVDSWLKDLLSKVVLTVRKVSPNTTAGPLSTPQPAKSTDQTTVKNILEDNSNSYEQASTPTQPSIPHELPVYGGVLCLLMCCVLVALVILYRKRSNTQSTSLKPPALRNQIPTLPPDQEEVCHVYDEMLAVYSLAGPATIENSSETYSVIQHVPPAKEDSSLYSFILPH